MRTRLFVASVIAVLMFALAPLEAQTSVNAEIRPRSEYSHGYSTLADLNQKGSFFTSQRTRLNLNYSDKKLSFKVSLQDVRVWGNQPQLVTNEDFATSLHEAWAQVKFNEEFSLKLGRQELAYDDHRIFGNVGWAQQARSHDLALVKYEGDFKIHLGLAYHENTIRTDNIYNGPDAYKTMQFLWGHKQWEDLSLSLLFLNNGTPFTEQTGPGGQITEQSIRYSQTFGPVAEYKFEKFNVSGNFYYQGGKDVNSNSLRAFEFAFQGSMDIIEEVNVLAGYEFLSGTRYDETEYNRSFSPLYGTNHKFNGHMDYFYVGNHTNNVGLQDVFVKGLYKKDKFQGGMAVHLFWAAAAIADNTSNYLGTEIDLYAGYTFTNNINFKAGYSQMLASSSMELLKGGNKDAIQNWGWVMLTFTPDLWVQ